MMPRTPHRDARKPRRPHRYFEAAPLALCLFVAGVLTDDHDLAVPLDDAALLTHGLD